MTDDNPKLKALIDSLPDEDRAALLVGPVPAHLVEPLMKADVSLTSITGQAPLHHVEFSTPDDVLELLKEREEG